MKAATVYQPWASLLAVGAKRYETRGWQTKCRGPIAIHAGLKFINSFPEYFGKIAHLELCEKLPGFAYMHNLPRGAVIATACLLNCHLIRDDGYSKVRPEVTLTKYIQRPNYAKEYIQGCELLFGDFTPGRYAWEFVNMKLLPEPIPARGQQGLWEWRSA